MCFFVGTPKALLRNMQIDFFNAQELNLQNGRTKASPTLNEEREGQKSVTERSFFANCICAPGGSRENAIARPFFRRPFGELLECNSSGSCTCTHAQITPQYVLECFQCWMFAYV